MELVVVVLTAMVIVGFLGAHHYLEKKRREQWAALAPTLGLQHLGEMPLPDSVASLKAFSTGRSRRMTSLLRGQSGRVSVLLGDYQYTTGSGKNSTTYRHTVCVLGRDGLDLPHCYLRPQNPFDAIGKLFGGQDIDFADDPVFSGAFVLQGSNVTAIRRHFDRSIRAWLVQHSHTLQRFEARGSVLAFLAPRMAPECARQLLDDALDFLMLSNESAGASGPGSEPQPGMRP